MGPWVASTTSKPWQPSSSTAFQGSLQQLCSSRGPLTSPHNVSSRLPPPTSRPAPLPERTFPSILPGTVVRLAAGILHHHHLRPCFFFLAAAHAAATAASSSQHGSDASFIATAANTATALIPSAANRAKTATPLFVPLSITIHRAGALLRYRVVFIPSETRPPAGGH